MPVSVTGLRHIDRHSVNRPWRTAHTLIYASGLIYPRMIAFFVGTGGEILILLQLFK